MSQTTILVIDDSATIRKMVDSHLSREGYRVILAPTAEEGIELASQTQPQVILLDHQLPGILGIEVAQQLIEIPEVAHIPVVVSSTLRKQAYLEYAEMPNVVDSLPKPYTPELLKTTVANAVENGAMIVSSQSGGTAVPEVIDGSANASLSGNLKQFGLREVLDFLNNSRQTGMLEIETALDRVYFYLGEGRIQAVTSTSVSVEQIAAALPEKYKDLGPLLKFTVGTGFSSQVEGLVELLDKKVLDPRMLKVLLRHQAAVLTRHCFTSDDARTFSFEADRSAPGLFTKAPLQVGLAALLVDAALTVPDAACTEGTAWVRRGLRGQNLDRGGLDARHMKLLSHLEEPSTAEHLATMIGMTPDETWRVLEGLEMADWVERQAYRQTRQVIAMESDRDGATLLRDLLNRPDGDYSGKVVRDRLGMQLLLRRNSPDAVLLPMDVPDSVELARTLRESGKHDAVRLIGVSSGGPQDTDLGADAILTRPYSLDDVLGVVNEALSLQPDPAGV